MDVREWAEGKIAEMYHAQLEELFGTPDSLKAYRLILAYEDFIDAVRVDGCIQCYGPTGDRVDEALAHLESVKKEVL